MRGITLQLCTLHGKSWIVWAGRVYGAPCRDRLRCERSTHETTFMLVPDV